MKTVCLSFLDCDEPEVLRNHRYYCARMQYQHEVVSVQGMQSAQHRLLYKYERILHQLRKLPDNALLICATQECVFFGMHSVEALMQGRDYLLPSVDLEDGHQGAAVQVWRNTPQIRALVTGFIAREKISNAHSVINEAQLHQDLEYQPPYFLLDGVCCTLKCCARSESGWSKFGLIWTLSIAEIEQCGGIHPLFRAAVFEHVNDWQQKGVTLLDFAQSPVESADAFTVYNAGAPLAIVMLYTPNIRSFGAIADANFQRYCKRNGYTLYVHREADPQVSGNWLKPGFLKKYLPQHEWVFWVDADILFLQQEQKLEPFLQGRDILATHDIGTWMLNSGLLGFKNTQQNMEIIDEMIHQIRDVSDKSSVYASGGDQAVIANILIEKCGWSLDAGMDIVSLNTPWLFQQDSSFMVHYYGMSTEYRSLMMATEDRRSMQG